MCRECTKAYAEEKINSQHVVLLCGGLDCKAILPKKPLVALLDPKTVQRWDVLVAQKTLELSKLNGLSRCPFCEFQCILPPVRQAPVFVCQRGQGGCGKVSCRLCKREEHPLRKCDEVVGQDAKGKRKSVLERARQELEEALSEALIQKCNKCRQKFVKEYGCNEMKCPYCKNVQWYVNLQPPVQNV